MDVDSPNSLKRCSSAPQINNLLPSAVVGVHHSVVPMEEGQSHENPVGSPVIVQQQQQQSIRQINPSASPINQQNPHSSIPFQSMSSSSTVNLQTTGSTQRDPPPTSFSNIFTPRVRRFSASFSPLAVISNGSSSPSRSGSCTPGPRLTPRISQLRQEECADLSNSREVNHEREIHSAMQMSQSYEDLTLVTENWSFSSSTKNHDDLNNPLHVALPTVGTSYCSSPSPTSRGGLGLQYPTSSPSPTRKFVTRRSMSPCPIRPSPLSSVKRKFDLEDNYGSCYSPPPLKKIFTTERGSSPVCQTPSPSPICASPDSSTASFENGSNNASSSGRITPKFFVTKLSSTQGNNLLSGGGNNGSGAGTIVGINTPHSVSHPLHTDSPPSSSSSSSLMMMDCGVSSSSGHHNLHDNQSKRRPRDATVSSSEGTKIDYDEDITDLNAVASSTSVTTESSEAVMEEVLKTTRPLDDRCDPELLDSSSSAVSNNHRLSTGSISNISTDNNSESNSSLCPLAFGSNMVTTPASSTNGSRSFISSNIELAET